MKVLIPNNIVPVGGVVATPYSKDCVLFNHPAQDGQNLMYSGYKASRWTMSSRYLETAEYQFHRGSFGCFCDTPREWLSETTDWFSTAEFVPPVEGWYECRVGYLFGVNPGQEHPKPYMFYWDGEHFRSGGYYFGSNQAFTKSNAIREQVMFFRGIQHQWKEKN